MCDSVVYWSADEARGQRRGWDGLLVLWAGSSLITVSRKLVGRALEQTSRPGQFEGGQLHRHRRRALQGRRGREEQAREAWKRQGQAHGNRDIHWLEEDGDRDGRHPHRGADDR